MGIHGSLLAIRPCARPRGNPEDKTWWQSASPEPGEPVSSCTSGKPRGRGADGAPRAPGGPKQASGGVPVRIGQEEGWGGGGGDGRGEDGNGEPLVLLFSLCELG